MGKILNVVKIAVAEALREVENRPPEFFDNLARAGSLVELRRAMCSTDFPAPWSDIDAEKFIEEVISESDKA